MEEAIKEIDRCARVLQKSLCSYRTTEGDGKICDCKFAFDYDRQQYKTEFVNKISEENGCAEARSIIWNIKKLEDILKSKLN